MTFLFCCLDRAYYEAATRTSPGWLALGPPTNLRMVFTVWPRESPVAEEGQIPILILILLLLIIILLRQHALPPFVWKPSYYRE